MQTIKLQTRLVALSLLLAFSGLTEAAVAGKTYHFTVLHTNDMHGRFWTNRQGELGLAAQKTLIDDIRTEVRARGGATLVLNAGDVNTGVPESDLQDAQPMFVGMNLIGYDAMAVGNHEFDKPLTVLRKQQGWAKFTMLSANIRDKHDDQLLFAASRQFDLGGLKVAVMGLTTPDTVKMAGPDNLAQLKFTDPQREASRLVPKLRRDADVVIALTHLGYYPDGQHGSQAPGDVELARAVPGIDLIVGGHSHTVLCMAAPNVLQRNVQPGGDCRPDRQNGTWIVQAGEWGKYVGRADFAYRDGKLKLLRYRLIPVNLKEGGGRTILPDASAFLQLRPFQENGQDALQRPVALLPQRLEGDRTRVRYQPTSLGLFAGKAMIARTHADMALLNSGGIRDSLSAGVVTYRDVLKVFPFGTHVVTVDLSGAELVTLLSAAKRMSPGSGGYPQFAGVEVSFKDGLLQPVRIAGQVLDPAKRYRLATNAFVASGGDGYPKLDGLPGFVDSGLTDAEVLADYLSASYPLQPAPAR